MGRDSTYACVPSSRSRWNSRIALSPAISMTPTAMANIIVGVFTLFMSPMLIKLTRVSSRYLFTFLLPIIFISVFVSREYMVDVIAVIIICILGILMNKHGYSVPAFILGFLLGEQFEYYLTHAIAMFGPIFFTSPLSILLILIIVLTLFYDPLKQTFSQLYCKMRKAA